MLDLGLLLHHSITTECAALQVFLFSGSLQNTKYTNENHTSKIRNEKKNNLRQHKHRSKVKIQEYNIIYIKNVNLVYSSDKKKWINCNVDRLSSNVINVESSQFYLYVYFKCMCLVSTSYVQVGTECRQIIHMIIYIMLVQYLPFIAHEEAV